MGDRMLGTAAWIGFALIVGYGGYLMLAACDLGIRPIFGLHYCKAQAAPEGLANERAREGDLQARIHQAELRIARLPSCLATAPPPSPPEPRPRAEARIPPPPPPPPPAQPEAAPPEELTIPQKLSDLKGCWQSVRGDLPLVTDDEEQRPSGNVRVCYCFADNGRGSARFIYTDGRKCVGPLRARLSDGKLLIDHNIHCVARMEITCRRQAEEKAAICDTVSRGRVHPGAWTDEKYQRVTAEHCN